MTVDENNPLDRGPPSRPDGLNAILANHISEKVTRLALASDDYQVIMQNSILF